jgi:hypothetical protein
MQTMLDLLKMPGNIQLCSQTMTFSGVEAHHQNGIAEKSIPDLQDLTRSSLIHAVRQWPDAITTHLWPYALRKANICKNYSIQCDTKYTPIELFSTSKVAPNLRHEHPFGCPVYVLDRKMQGSMKAPKWECRGQIAIYLGTSEFYARSVGLVLSLSTGLEYMVTSVVEIKRKYN